MNEPMSYFDFTHYIKKSQEECDWIDNFYKLGFEGLAEKIWSYDNSIDLISKIFNDTTHVLHDWIYETNYGRDNNINMIYKDKYIRNIKDIYDILIQIYNKEIDWTEIEIKRGDDLSQIEECSPNV